MNIADGYEAICLAALRGAAPDPELRIDEWSEAYMVLPSDAAEPGAYRLERTPLARRILQVLSPRHPAKRIVIKGASQMLKTQIALNFLCACAHRAPGNMLVLEPTDLLAKRLSARVSKTIRDVPVLQSIFAPARSRDSRNTVFAKDFRGGTMYIATAGAAANLAEIPAPYIVIDEVDRLSDSVDGEGDPVEIAEARATTFQSRCKFLEVSSPTMAGSSKIDKLYDMGTREVPWLPCPHCAHHHELVLEHFHYERDEDTGHMARAWFVCPECGAEIDERHKGWMLRDAAMGGTAHWHAQSVGDGETLSFHVSAFHAQVGSISWLQLARQHARAKERLDRGDPDAMQVFFNTRLALSWENALERTTVQELQQRQLADPFPPRVIPERALVVTFTVDVQPNRLELQAHAWGPDLEHWVIDYQVLMGAPTVPPDVPGSVWARLDEYRREPFVHASGATIAVSAFAVDSGGHNTQDVYNYGQSRAHAGCVILHGSSRPNRPIISSLPSKVDIDWQGRRIDGGALLWTIGTDVAKDHLFNRWKLAHGGGAMHFHSQLDAAWFEGLLAERLVMKRKPGGGYRRVYEKAGSRDRNEPLDCFDDQTEVLTARGWLPFRTLVPDDQLATVDLDTDRIEYQRPAAIIARPYVGELLCVQGTRLNFAVTPGHRMVTYRKEFDRTARKWNFDGPPTITLAQDLTIHHTIKISARWEPSSVDHAVQIPASVKATYGTEIEPERSVGAHAMAAFLGWYVAEGYARINEHDKSVRRLVCICQTKAHGRQQIERVLAALPWRWHYDGASYVITSKQLHDYIEQTCPGHQDTRRAPAWVKFSSCSVIAAFVDAAVAGDGWTQMGVRSYATISPLLADDMAEMFFKLGGSPSVTERAGGSVEILGNQCTARTQYWVRENNRRKSAALDGGGRKAGRGFMVKPVPYDGMVYCATVPNGTLVVRRKGKMLVAGNCAVYNLAMAYHLGLHKWSALDWQRLRDKLIAKPAAVAAVADVPAPAADEAARPPVQPSVQPPAPVGRRILNPGIR